ncbi:glycosyltransferase family 9 protein [Asticcacaulis sp. AC402]|uniref:glycosyltransferase family 9 protein n=1 Tax=Asticcacaulis sp. AC402 TaxID=1282361 RepID=UPI0003C3E918|nr:glycosyltransferase family 9 protein [Asticcacaulis sp. AC402]ESQ76813.1 hypothetical protein ABAC402_03895 [Asticcacaulis sp. AC402]
MKSSFPILLLALCEPARAIALGGVIPRLKQEIPHARITLVTTTLSAELFQDETAIDELLAFDGAIFKLKSLGALAELSRRPWGLLVDVGPSMVSRMIRSKTRFVVNPNEAAGPLRQICQALALQDVDVVPRLAVSDSRIGKAQALLDSGRLTAPFLVMAPGATWMGRRWPTERFAVLATRLMREDGPFANHNLLIVGAEADRDTAVALSMATPRVQVMEMAGKLDLLTTCAVLKKAAAFVGNDEIWLRLAAAAGIATFGLYGPSDEADAPPGPNMHAIRGPRSLAEIRAGDPKLKQSACHMLDLTIDSVFDAVDTLTARPKPEPGIIEDKDEAPVVLDDDPVTPVPTTPLAQTGMSPVRSDHDNDSIKEPGVSDTVMEDVPVTRRARTSKTEAAREPAHAEKL